MSYKRIFARTAQNPVTQVAVAAAMVISGPAAVYNYFADDLDKNAVASENDTTRDLRGRLAELRSLSDRFVEAKDAYLRALPDRNASDYEVRMNELKDSGEFDRLTGERDRLRVEYTNRSDAFKTDLVLNPQINEVTYGQFAELMPPRAFKAQRVNLDGDGASLNECRVKYGQNVAAQRVDLADQISTCMRNNDEGTFWMTLISLIVFGLGAAGTASAMHHSRTLDRWARLPKPAKN